MRIAIGLLVALPLCVILPHAPSVAAPVPKALKAKKTDAEMLEGRWECVSMDDGRGPQPRPGTDAILNGVFYPGGNTEKLSAGLRILLDSTKSPKHFDLDMSAGQTLPGIYQLDGDTFTWCHNQPGKSRPTEFKGGDGPTFSFVFKRAKE